MQTKYTGGTVLHGFIGERLVDENSVKLAIEKNRFEKEDLINLISNNLKFISHDELKQVYLSLNFHKNLSDDDETDE